MINCLILDDEPLALDLLESYLKKISGVKLLARCSEPLVAMDFIAKNKVDLLFVDIHMPDITGINLVKLLNFRCEVIFTTAYDEYALTGFELKALDYLLKPFSFERFVDAINRAANFIENKNGRQQHGKEFFFINAAHKIHKIFYSDIIYLEGLKDYTKIHLASSAVPLLVLQSLKYFEDLLPEGQFSRIHRSYIVPIARLDTITRKEVTIGPFSLPVGDIYRDGFFSSLSIG